MKRSWYIFFFLCLLAACLFPKILLAKVGVGVGTGKITIDEPLYPGTIYELPRLTVLNTGDETAEYEVTVSYHQDQPEQKPPADWIRYEPRQFTLTPNQVQNVAVTLAVPVKAIPGGYFAYLEAHPLATAGRPGTSIGVAAAAKLYFTVAPANLVLGAYYRGLSLFRRWQPWSNLALAGLAALAAGLVFRRFFNLRLSVRRKQKPTDSQDE